MEALGIIFFVFGFVLMVVCSADEYEGGIFLGLILFIIGILCGVIDYKIKQQTPEYKLQQIKNEIDNIHQDSVNYQKEKQKKLWIWKRTKELEDSLIKLR